MPALQSLADVAHVGLLFGPEPPQHDGEDQPERAVWADVDVRTEPRTLSCRLQPAREGDLQGAAVMHLPSSRPVVLEDLQLHHRAQLPLRPKPRPDTDWAVRDLLHYLAGRVPFEFAAVVRQVV